MLDRVDVVERFGDSSVIEVLRRLPGVTSSGRPGRGGYTQLLVNGERMHPVIHWTPRRPTK